MRKGLIRVVIGIVALIGIIGAFIYFNGNKEKFKVELWDNIYNEDNIEFFYENSESEKIESLEKSYGIKSIVGSEYREIDKAIKSISILNAIVTLDDVANSKYKNGYDILREKNGQKKISDKDLGIVYRDIIYSWGAPARIGIFRGYKGFFKEDIEYRVVEYWDKQFEKWIAIDYTNKCYFKKDNIPLSGIELLNYNIEECEVVGEVDESQIRKLYNKINKSYTINIDNTFEQKLSNVSITYIKNVKNIELIHNEKYLPSTIYTTEKSLFEKTSMNNKISNDENAYLVFMKKEVPEIEKAEYVNTFIIGAFKDGKILEEYYLSVNEDGFQKINKYKEVNFEMGQNIVSLSLDGENVINTVGIKRQE